MINTPPGSVQMWSACLVSTVYPGECINVTCAVAAVNNTLGITAASALLTHITVRVSSLWEVSQRSLSYLFFFARNCIIHLSSWLKILLPNFHTVPLLLLRELQQIQPHPHIRICCRAQEEIEPFFVVFVMQLLSGGEVALSSCSLWPFSCH